MKPVATDKQMMNRMKHSNISVFSVLKSNLYARPNPKAKINKHGNIHFVTFTSLFSLSHDDATN